MPPVFQKSQPLLALHLALRPSPPPPFALTSSVKVMLPPRSGERRGRTPQFLLPLALSRKRTPGIKKPPGEREG